MLLHDVGRVHRYVLILSSGKPFHQLFVRNPEVVFPDAELKIFVTASARVRAQRRYDELIEKGMPADFDDILKNVEERDYIDSHREVSPLRQADDALLLDNSNMTIPEQNAWLMERVEETLSRV